MKYNWQLADWPNFSYKTDSIRKDLSSFTVKNAHTAGILKAMPDGFKMDSVIEMLVAEAIKTSEIEGEYFSRQDVLSSIKNNLGLNNKKEKIKNKRAAGIGALMVDSRSTFNDPLTEQTLFRWHQMLMADTRGIEIGKWRSHTEPMLVVSGPSGKEKIHFEAPPSSRVAKEMKQFLQWFKDTAPDGKMSIHEAPVRSAIAHLYFESIHPFEDGNGRIGRAIAEKALSQGLGYPVLLSVSKTIESNKKDYYLALETAQHSNQLTTWITYFIKTILLALEDAEAPIDFTLKKVKLFDRYRLALNARQTKVINRIVAEGPRGFTGGMNAGKYMGITKTSKATATRDLQLLTELGVFRPLGGGRSTRYELVM